MTLTGRIVVKTVSPGSKSERRAVCLETPKGTYVLRPLGAHPLRVPPELEALEGRTVRAEGTLSSGTFIATSWEAL